jgi:hypothetical protein
MVTVSTLSPSFSPFSIQYPSARRQINHRTQHKDEWNPGFTPIPPLFPKALAMARRRTHTHFTTTSEFVRAVRGKNNDDDDDDGPPIVKLHIFNFHRDEDLLRNFACNVLDARHTCRARQADVGGGGGGGRRGSGRNSTMTTTTTSSSNSSTTTSSSSSSSSGSPSLRLNVANYDSLLYDEIVSFGASEGLFDPTKVRRWHAMALAQQWHHNDDAGGLPLPMTCPTDQALEEYLNISMMVEQEMVPEFHTTTTTVVVDTERAVRSSFWEEVRTSPTKYCHVDTESVRNDPHWTKFFATLRPSVQT